MAFVSVIIPVYNRAHCIKKTIQSVLNQSFSDLEIILVDDGSTDSLMEAISEFSDSIQLIRQENHGVSHARNSGITRAKGEWIAFLDSDDLWLEKKLEMQIAAIKKEPEIKVCHTEEIWIRNGIRVNQCKHHQKYGGFVYEKMLPLCGMSPSSILIHKSVFENVGLFDPLFLACEDYELWLRITCRYPVIFVKEPCIIKTGGHEDQLSRKYPAMDQFRIKALIKTLRICPLPTEMRKITLETLEKKAKIYIKGCIKHGREAEAKECEQLIEPWLSKNCTT